jgi:hypothetical protein
MHWLWRVVAAVLAGSLMCSAATGAIAGLVIRLSGFDLAFMMAAAFVVGIPGSAMAAAAYALFSNRFGRMTIDRETRCRKCGYILRGVSEPRCSECGERI